MELRLSLRCDGPWPLNLADNRDIPAFSPAMISPNPESILCHCLRVTVGQVQTVIAEGGCAAVRDVMRCTGAGKGCMSCHSRIRSLLAGRSPAWPTFAVPACPGCENPACGCAAGRKNETAGDQRESVETLAAVAG